MSATTTTTDQAIELAEAAHTLIGRFLKLNQYNPTAAREPLCELRKLVDQIHALRLPRRRLNALPNVLALTFCEQEALRRASSRGWLEITPTVGDHALKRWQQDCQRKRHPLGLSRPEATRTSIWVVLAEGYQWSREQRQFIMNSRTISSVVLNQNSLRAFVPRGGEDLLFAQLMRPTNTLN